VPFRVYLGTAPGVGKTYAMLTDAWQRSEAGQKVLVGWLQRHGRAETGAQLRDLERLPPRTVSYRGRDFDELDLPALLERAPDIAVIDELAHTNVGENRPRWEDVATLLDAGIGVLTTVNIANLESARELAAQITGAGTVESVPDDFVRSAEIVLVDLPPEALRRRVASGRVLSAEGVGGALSNYFRTDNLTGLSELAHAWLKGTLDEEGPAIVARYGSGTAASRPVVLAGVSDSEFGVGVVQRAADLAASADADLVVVHVVVADGLSRRSSGRLAEYQELADSLGGAYIEVQGTDAAGGLARVARDQGAVQVVVARHRSRLNELWRGSVTRQLRRLLPDIPVEEVRVRPQ
jgi:two-component system sensor histidine kinase KdpD